MQDQPSWAVAICEPQRDFTAEQALRRDGHRVLFLYYRKLLTGHRGDWRKTHAFVSRPLFEGYGFIQLWPGQDFPDSTRVSGFDRILMIGQSPLWLSDAKIMGWQERTQQGEFDDKLPEKRKASNPFQPANSEAERKKVLEELAEKLRGQYAVAS